MAAPDMQRFWDDRAREDPFFFVDNRQAYGEADLERFWEDGRRDLARMLSLAEEQIRRDDAVLDLGCGVGRLTRPLAGRAREVVALDVSEEMLAVARRHNADLRNVRWMHGDGTSLAPLADASLDACISAVVFQHLPDPGLTLGYIAEIGRVLRPGGWAALHVSTEPAVHRRRLRPRVVVRRAKALAGWAPRGQGDSRWRGSAVPLPALERAAVDAGMEVERVANPGHQFSLVVCRRTRPVSPGE